MARPATVGPALDPLPPVDMPLADTFDELVARADGGDARAACRLALELQVCQTEMARIEYFADAILTQTRVDPNRVDDANLQRLESHLNLAQSQLDILDAMRAHCRDIHEVGMDRRLDWWWQAARGGSRVALHELFTGDVIPLHGWLRHADHLVRLQRELEPLAWQAMRNGDLQITWHLLNALKPSPEVTRIDLLAQVMDADAEQALSLALYLQDALRDAPGDAEVIVSLAGMAGNSVTRMDALLSPEQQERARATARGWSRSITPLPVSASTFSRGHYLDDDPMSGRAARTEMCGEGGP